MAPHSSTLAWKIPWMEEPGRLQSMGSRRVRQTEQLDFYFSLSCIGGGNGNPLQCSCLENPRDGGAWLAAVYGVAQSRTRLKRLSSSSSSRSWRGHLNRHGCFREETSKAGPVANTGRYNGERNLKAGVWQVSLFLQLGDLWSWGYSLLSILHSLN